MPDSDRTCKICAVEHPGTVVNADETACVCPTGTYSRRSRDNTTVDACEDCAMLESDSHILGLYDPEQPVSWESEQVCPGGGLAKTSICTIDELWIRVDEPDDEMNPDLDRTHVHLATCPSCVSRGSCAATNPPSEGNETVGWGDHTADCADNHTGFLCAECIEGHKSVEGRCVLCDKVDWWLFVSEALSSIAIGLLLLHKVTTKSVCAPAQAEPVFRAMDIDGSGYLRTHEVRYLLLRMGNPVAAFYKPDKELAAMKAKKVEDLEMQLESISLSEFQEWCNTWQNRATVGTFIFAAQTFALIAAQYSSFSLLQFLNLDVKKAAQTCRAPICGLFCGMMGMLVVPFYAGLTIYLGMYCMSTCVGNEADLNHYFEKKGESAADDPETAENDGSSNQSPTAGEASGLKGLPLRNHHLQRGLLQLFLFTFAPVTRQCAELLICRNVFEHTRMVSDLSLECWEGRHLGAAILAILILLLYVVVIPAWAMKSAGGHIRAAQASEAKNNEEASAADEDEPTAEPRLSGSAHCWWPRSWLGDRPFPVDKHINQKQLAIMKKIPTLNPVVWDELVKATRPKRYWWFFFIMLLKLMVNIIFLLGTTLRYNWGMCKIVMLSRFACCPSRSPPKHHYCRAADHARILRAAVGLSATVRPEKRQSARAVCFPRSGARAVDHQLWAS